MDIRGIEVTNQLRSAIRAKLLELGVRYDEELPDYILVMVVNKKTRQQMYEDLCLFLEESTSPFVDWLHDQVLKKLQKVTVAKKKSSRDLVPTVVVKQEEERKKKKSCPTSFLEDQTNDLSDKTSDKISKLTKLPKKPEKLTKPLEPNVIYGLESAPKKSSQLDKASVLSSSEVKSSSSSNLEISHDPTESDKMNTKKNVESLEHSSKSSIEAEISIKMSEISSKNSKKVSTNPGNDGTNKVEVSGVTVCPLVSDEVDGDSDEDSRKKVKSSINKPRITSVVTVKNRLEFPGSRNKFDVYKNRLGFESRYRNTVRGGEKQDFETGRRGDVFSGRNNREEDHFRRNIIKNHEFETRNQESDKVVDIKSRLGNVREDKFNKCIESKDKSVLSSNSRMRNMEKLSNSIKDRLGSGNSMKVRENFLNKRKESSDEQRNSKFPDKEKSLSNLNSSIKNRLGPVKNTFKSPHMRRGLNLANKSFASSEDEDCLSLRDDVNDSDDDTESNAANSPLKSRIIAVKRNVIEKTDRKRMRVTKDAATGGKDDDDEDAEDRKIASKVIVTPRPLKPLQPLQKRATQSLLLRAVAEANQSVVKQKNPEPVLTQEKKTTPKCPAPSGIREGKNLSVRLNSSKRLVMEKIQVELTTGESDIENPEPYVPQPVTDEHMGVVMSLFQRSNDSQKFLVTLNGYNNNVLKDKSVSDEDERLEMEVNDDDDFINSNTEEFVASKASLNGFQLTDLEAVQSVDNKIQTEASTEHLNIDTIDTDHGLPKKKRKLSPIVYNRSRSSSPVHTKLLISPAVCGKNLEKHAAVENTVQQSAIEKSKEKCRYWPNCTLGIKCTYYHPAALCSAFPACKFGEKCLYKHPKCKFGLSCTKLGCVYRHPPRQCKYHPYCTNPTCTYTHPLPQVQPVEVVSNRAKFTWRKHE